jgi:hypothetical protein
MKIPTAFYRAEPDEALAWRKMKMSRAFYRAEPDEALA